MQITRETKMFTLLFLGLVVAFCLADGDFTDEYDYNDEYSAHGVGGGYPREGFIRQRTSLGEGIMRPLLRAVTDGFEVIDGGTSVEGNGGRAEEGNKGTSKEGNGGTPEEGNGGTPKEGNRGTPKEGNGGTLEKGNGGTPEKVNRGSPRGGAGKSPRGGAGEAPVGVDRLSVAGLPGLPYNPSLYKWFF